ncbi:aldehyde:ferredoxin oxidoreductase, partial [Thaumarchaeota archaeon SCGC AB-539-E09]
MPGGYAGKFLDVDLTREKIKDTVIDDETLEAYLGGRGLGAKILWDRIGKNWHDIEPLGPENIFIALTGPMTGIYPGGRICCTGKSPVSNGTVGSTAATELAHELKTAGYDGVIVSGKASNPVYIMVTDEGGEIRDASHLWGKLGDETIKMLNREVGEELRRRNPNIGLLREPGKIYIGPAGENMVRNAAVMSKLCHAGRYGGYGSVMGSKNLKAIVAKGRGPLPEVYAPEAVKVLWRKVHDYLINRDAFRRQGTGY